MSGIQPQGSRSAVVEGRDAMSQAGSNGPARQRGRESVAAAARSPLAARAESSDRRVSDPSVERARLRGRGGSGCCFHGRRPSLQTHFGWRPAINSELARTRGIRLSN